MGHTRVTRDPAPNSPIHVAAGVVRAGDGRVLIQQRPPGRDHAGYWEFPGGKIEPGEGAAAALARELDEELGIRVVPGPLRIRVPWDYGHLRVVLHVLDCADWSGTPRGREGQAVVWSTLQALSHRRWPAANLPIIHALQLPDRYLITPQDPDDPERWLEVLEAALAGGIRLVQLRRPERSPDSLVALGRRLRARCDAYGATLLVNAPDELAAEAGGHGVHWNARTLAATPRRPGWARWVAASCHSPGELEQAAACGADFAVLSPVQRTASHPERQPLGWAQFAAWVADAPLPVFALGGLGPEDVATARSHGAQGIAAIRGLLPSRCG